MNSALPQLALAGLALGALVVWSRRREAEASGGLPSIVAGKVKVENVEAIEEALGWQYLGPSGRVVIHEGTVGRDGSMAMPSNELRLFTGAWYSHKVRIPGNWSVDRYAVLWMTTGDKGRYDPESDQWDSWWKSEILTLAQQVAVGTILPVPPDYQA